jgi:hypothetical protein
MSTKKTNRSEQQSADQKLIDGLTKHAATIPFLVVGGASHPTADIINAVQARLATATAALSTRATWLNAVKADADERSKTKVFVSGVRQALQVAFAGSIDTLADFGLTPRKPPAARTPEQKAAAAAKARATRVARHTMGAKQKKGVRGAVTGVVVTPVTAAQPSAAQPTAAAAAGASAPAPSTGASSGGTPHP